MPPGRQGCRAAGESTHWVWTLNSKTPFFPVHLYPSLSWLSAHVLHFPASLGPLYAFPQLAGSVGRVGSGGRCHRNRKYFMVLISYFLAFSEARMVLGTRVKADTFRHKFGLR